MKKIVSALAAAALLAMPMAAAAQGHGGGFHGGGARAAGGFHGGYRGGFRGGYGYRGWHGWHGGYGFYPYYGLGFGLGFALAADPWFYGFPGYGYWDGPCGAWGCGYYYDDAPPPGPGPGVGPSGGASPPAACGNWVWHADQGRYTWVPQACGPAGPPAAGAPPAGD